MKTELPKPKTPEAPLRPDKPQLQKLVETYSNIAIGKIYGVSEMAVRKWLTKFGIARTRIVQSDITDESELDKIREKLKAKLS
jgi:nicotinic acid phosphoribosyltransferase